MSHNDSLTPAAAPPVALRAFRRYVTGFVNRHDFAVLPDIMVEDYELVTSGMTIRGRDGAYKSAVARQLEQFPGLQFTVHQIFVAGDSIGVRFTEHGASSRHGGTCAAWPSIAIYDTQGERLARCTIEQDYYARRSQLEYRVTRAVDRPAIAPWDETELAPSASDEALVADWLSGDAWLGTKDVAIDDSAETGAVQPVLLPLPGSVSVLRAISGQDRSGKTQVAFHAIQSGKVDESFAREAGGGAGVEAHLHLSGIVTVRAGQVIGGNIIRDRWGLFRRLAAPRDR